MKDRRPLLVFAIFLIVAAGIVLVSRSGKDEPAASDDTSTVETTSTTVTKNGTKTTGTTGANGTTTIASANADQWRSIFDRIIATQNELLQNPNPSRVDEIMDPSCTCYSETRTGLQTLVDKKWHVKGDTLQVRTAAIVNDGATTKTITATFIRTNSPTVDASDKVQQQPTASFTNPVLYTLKKNAKGVWLVYERTTYEERQS